MRIINLVNLVCMLSISTAVSFPSKAIAINYELVAVGNAGNAADTTGYGAVGYDFQIGKYEVTIGQYAAFLNAVAKTDTYGLYNPGLATDVKSAGIARSGSAGAYSYSVLVNSGNSANRPITHIRWFDAARFANWMSNGQPTGAQSAGTTETGAYMLNGKTTGVPPAKNLGAIFYVPTENEWYKAAYYAPVLRSGSGGYYRFATQSNSDPGNVVGSLPNQANWFANNIYSFEQSPADTYERKNHLTDVGSFTASASFYGTYDQSGNVFEWNDLTGQVGAARSIRGGYWGWYDGTPQTLSSAGRYSSYNADGWGDWIGFRLANSVVPYYWAPQVTGFGGTGHWIGTSWTVGPYGQATRVGSAFSANDRVVFTGSAGTVYVGGTTYQPSVEVAVPGYRFEINSDSEDAVFQSYVAINSGGLTRFANDANPAGFWDYKFLGGLTVATGTVEVGGGAGIGATGVIANLGGAGTLDIKVNNQTLGMRLSGSADFSGVVRLSAGRTRLENSSSIGTAVLEFGGGSLDLNQSRVANRIVF